MFLGTTPANQPDSPEYMPRGGGGGESEFLANQMSLHDEAAALVKMQSLMTHWMMSKW